jgi:hypothetical protein
MASVISEADVAQCDSPRYIHDVAAQGMKHMHDEHLDFRPGSYEATIHWQVEIMHGGHQSGKSVCMLPSISILRNK